MQSVVVITGAASGLGWALVKLYLDKGHFVYLVDIQSVLLDKRLEEIHDAGQSGLAAAVVSDVTKPEDLDELVKVIEARHNCLHVLINNAGITHRSLIDQTDLSVFKKVMSVDYEGPVALTLKCLPLLKKSNGTVINISSMAGWMPVIGRAGYCAAKSAMHQFFEVLRCELRQKGISVLMAYPSFVDTPIEQAALGGDGEKAQHQRSTVGRIATADSIAEQIFQAYKNKKERLFPDRFTYLASVLYKLWPSLFLRLMTNKFKQDLESPLETKKQA